MLRSEIRFSLDGRPQRLLAVLLSESFLGFLAIVAVGLTLFPILFEVKPTVIAAIDTLQWLIIGWFALEFVVAWASARAKAAFLRSPWRWLDLATIVVPLASLLPSVSHALLSSPVLRLVRLVRLVALGVRVSGVAVRHHARVRAEARQPGPAEVTLMKDAPQFAPVPATWTEVIGWLRAPGREWYHVSNPNRAELTEMNAAAGLPAGFLESHLLATHYPHLAAARSFAALFVWLPELGADGRVERQGVLLLASTEGLLTLSRHSVRVIERITPAETAVDGAASPASFAAQQIARVLERAVQQNEAIVGKFEHELRGLEEVPIRDSSPGFFERTFHLKKELSAAQSDLWRFKGLLAELGEGRMPGLKTEAEREPVRRLAARAEYLYETVVNIRDEVLSVMELHLNIVSFDMNRVMRVLAVVSVLGLIPAVVGGLFGMNLSDNPWPFTLPQVAFVICFAMVLGLYLFFVKGWLR